MIGGHEISASDEADCIRREIAMRRRVYPRLIAGGKLSPARADREIAIMEAVLLRCERAAEAERLI